MKSRDTLIRLKRFNVDEKRRRVTQIETMIAEFTRIASDLDDVRSDEIVLFGDAGVELVPVDVPGIGSAQGQAYSAGQSMAQAARSMANDSGSAYTWGSHLASNLASGISAGIGWVESAAANIAARARSILGFSVPEDGPWSGAEKGGETSGLHLAQNFASGMEKGRSVVQAAADGLASAARPTAAGQAPTGADRYPEGLELLREAVNLLSAIASRDEGVYMDADKVSAALTRRARSTAAGRGCRI